MTLEITVATLVVLGYALGSYADEKRSREKLSARPLLLSLERRRRPLPSP